MSAPDTNIETQERRHQSSLMGIKGAMLFGALMMVLLGSYQLFVGSDASAYVDDTEVAPQTSTVETDVYAPGTNSSAIPAATD